MKKRIFSLLLILFILSNTVVFSADGEVEGSSPYGNLNLDILLEKGFPVYGSPEDLMPNNEYDSATGEWRYLGYSAEGLIFSNVHFPNDAFDATKAWHERDYVKKPWREGLTDATEYDIDPLGTGKIDSVQGISDKYGFTGQTHVTDGVIYDGSTLSDYVSLFNLKTTLTPATGRSWHTIGGKTWYKTWVGPLEPMYNILNIKHLEVGTNNKLATDNRMILINGWHDIDAEIITDYSLVNWDYDTGVYTGDSSPASVQVLFDGTEHELIFYYTNKTGAVGLSMDVDPNPVQLEGGQGTHDLELQAEAYLFDSEIPEKWTLTYQREGGAWVEQIIETNDTKVSWNVSNLLIFSDQRYNGHVICETNLGNTYEADAFATALVVEEQVGNINAELSASCINDPINVNEIDANVGTDVTAELFLDASDSDIENEPAEYMFYVAQNNMPDKKWTYFDWQSDTVLETPFIINPKYRNASDVVELDCRVWVRDADGFMRAAHDDANVNLNIRRTPPETKITGQERYFPIEITNVTGTDINRLTWSYDHPESVPYSHSILNVDRIEGTSLVPVITNRIQSERSFDITGNENDEFIVSVKVVDTNNTESDVDEAYCYIETASPKIELVIDDAEINNNILYYQVSDLTPQTVLDHFPTQYTLWYVWDTNGDLLESGTGKMPASIVTDTRYDGQSIIAMQYATNNLGKTAKAKDMIINASNLDFTLNPSQLFEGEMTSVTANLKGLTTTPVWEIKSVYENDTTYTPFAFTNDEFTQSKGFYDVRLSAEGNFVTYQYDYDFSNDRKVLMGDAIQPTDADVKSIFGDAYEYVWLSSEFIGNIEAHTDGYYVGSTKYNFRRLKKYMIVTQGAMSDVEQVEFLNGKPSSYFEMSGDKEHRTLTLDGTRAMEFTDDSLKAKYPIDYASLNTKFTVEGYTNGSFDASLNDLIHGEGKVIENNKVTFPQKQIQALRYDGAGQLHVSYQTDNTLNVSDLTELDKSIVADIHPSVELATASQTVHRDKTDSLDATLMFIANYNSTDDNINTDTSYFSIPFDANNNGDFTDDGVFSNMKVYKNSHNCPALFDISANFLSDVATVQIKTQSTDKNLLGQFKGDFVVVENPIEAYLHVNGVADPVVDSNTDHQPIEEKLITIENMQPSASIDIGRIPLVEVKWLSHGSTDDELAEINLLLTQFAQDRIKCIVHYHRNSTVTELNNFDQFEE